MKANYWYVVIIIMTTLHLFSFICAARARRCFALYEAAHQQGQVLMCFQASSLDSKQDYKRIEMTNVNEKAKRGLRTLGSRPPNCEHRCGDCKPCVGVQVPARTSTTQLVGVQYANYEPEGWKCKCGESFSTP